MKLELTALAATGCLAGCANVHERPLALGDIGFNGAAVLGAERDALAMATAGSRARAEIGSIEAVDMLRCVTVDWVAAETPRCDYRLRYRRPDGASATMMRRKQFFQRDAEGRWQWVIIVQGD
ncbi:MAG: hypothetical protein ACJ8EB_05840 [Allosphingosinicella sp.]